MNDGTNIEIPIFSPLELGLYVLIAASVAVAAGVAVALLRRHPSQLRRIVGSAGAGIVATGCAAYFLGPPKVDRDGILTMCGNGASSAAIAMSRGVPDDKALTEFQVQCRRQGRLSVGVASGVAAATLVGAMVVSRRFRRVG